MGRLLFQTVFNFLSFILQLGPPKLYNRYSCYPRRLVQLSRLRGNLCPKSCRRGDILVTANPNHLGQLALRLNTLSFPTRRTPPNNEKVGDEQGKSNFMYLWLDSSANLRAMKGKVQPAASYGGWIPWIITTPSILRSSLILRSMTSWSIHNFNAILDFILSGFSLPLGFREKIVYGLMAKSRSFALR